MASYDFLSQADEDALHKKRLLTVEERPFRRMSKRILSSNSLLNNTPSKLPTPPPEAEHERNGNGDTSKGATADATSRQQLHDDIILDFAAFDHAISRLHHLQTANAAERERYSADRTRILQTAQEVRDNTALLRIQLEEARKTLTQRKAFDLLAEKITSNVLLRPRRDQEANLAKLEEECRELERESEQYAATWRERREQFGRIVEEGMQLRRLIRDEKEEVERREGMEDGQDGEGEDGEVDVVGNRSPRGSSGDGMTSQQERAASPGGEKALKSRPGGLGLLSRGNSRAPTSRGASPAVSGRKSVSEGSMLKGGAEDTTMEEAPVPVVKVNTGVEEGEAHGDEGQQSGNGGEDKMDTT